LSPKGAIAALAGDTREVFLWAAQNHLQNVDLTLTAACLCHARSCLSVPCEGGAIVPATGRDPEILNI
jgi:hypothetical protein